MSKIKVVGNAMVLTAELNVTEMKAVTKFNPESLALIDEEGNETFSVKFGTNASISKYGVVFNEETAEGKAQLTTMLPEGLTKEKKVEYIKENYSRILLNLNELELLATDELQAFTNAMNEVEASIEVL